MAYRDALLALAEDLEQQEREEAARVAEAARIAAEARRLEELRRCGCCTELTACQSQMVTGHSSSNISTTRAADSVLRCAHSHNAPSACSGCEVRLILVVRATCCLPAVALQGGAAASRAG
jgi:hypothetical protein